MSPKSKKAAKAAKRAKREKTQGRPLCEDTNKDGSPCGNRAKKGETKCASHLKLAKRPSKLEGAKQTLIEALELGNSIEGACAYAGIGTTTYFRWLEVGEADEEHDQETPYREFRDDALRAQGVAEQSLVAEIRRAGTGFVDPETRQRKGNDWRAAAFLLERRHPDRWGQRQNVKHSGNVRTGKVVVPVDSNRLGEVSEILKDAGVLS